MLSFLSPVIASKRLTDSNVTHAESLGILWNSQRLDCWPLWDAPLSASDRCERGNAATPWSGSRRWAGRWPRLGLSACRPLGRAAGTPSEGRAHAQSPTPQFGGHLQDMPSAQRYVVRALHLPDVPVSDSSITLSLSYIPNLARIPALHWLRQGENALLCTATAREGKALFSSY